MKNSLHPYAMIFGVGTGAAVFAALRHPLFALFAGVAATVLFDITFKSIKSNKDE